MEDGQRGTCGGEPPFEGHGDRSSRADSFARAVTRSAVVDGHGRARRGGGCGGAGAQGFLQKRVRCLLPPACSDFARRSQHPYLMPLPDLLSPPIRRCCAAAPYPRRVGPAFLSFSDFHPISQLHGKTRTPTVQPAACQSEPRFAPSATDVSRAGHLCRRAARKNYPLNAASWLPCQHDAFAPLSRVPLRGATTQR